MDSFGNPEVITASDNIDLCSKMTVETFDEAGNSRDVYDETNCTGFATEQDGSYTLQTIASAPYENYKIKSTAFYLKKYVPADRITVIMGTGTLHKDTMKIEKDKDGYFNVAGTVDFNLNEIY